MKLSTHAFICYFLVFLVALTPLALRAQTHTPKYISMCSKSKGYYEYLPQGYDPSTTTTYPLLIFLTGIGEFGDGSSTQLPYVLKNGVPKLIQAGTFPKSFTSAGKTQRFIIITPQFLKGSNPTASDLNTVLNYIIAHYKVNTKRVYITGLSYGGGLSFGYAGNSSTYAARIAAIVPVASPLPDGGNSTIYARSRVIAAGNVPVWATHNKYDRYPDSSLNTITYINDINLAPAPNPKAKMTLFSAYGHDAWTKTYDPNYRENGYNVYEWMLLFQKGSAPPPPNTAPTAYSGSDKTVTLPTNSVTLSGSGKDSDGSIAAYSWTKISGPIEGTITSPTSASTTVTGLVRGIYTFRLMVSDNMSAKGVDDIKITVNPAPGTKAIQVNIYGGSNAYSNTYWNNWNVGTSATTNKTSSAFKYLDGTTSTVSATLSATGGVSDNGSAYGTGVAVAPAPVLRYASNYNGVRTLTLKGLSTSKTYTVDLYASRNSSTAGSTIFTINGTSKTINAVNNCTSKATFTSIKPNSSGQIVVTINKSATYNYLNAVILTESTSSTASMQAANSATDSPAVPEKQLAMQGAPRTEVYPNPTNSNALLTLNNGYTGIIQLQIIDESGKSRKVLQLQKNEARLQQTLPMADLPNGIYYISIQMGQVRDVKEVIKL